MRSRTNHFTPYEKYKETRKIPENAPTLAELEAKGHYQPKQELRDINHITTTEYDNEDMKREYIGMENNTKLLNDLAIDPNNIKNYLPEQSWLAFQEWKNLIK